jgi:hypothetical protein
LTDIKWKKEKDRREKRRKKGQSGCWQHAKSADEDLYIFVSFKKFPVEGESLGTDRSSNAIPHRFCLLNEKEEIAGNPVARDDECRGGGELSSRVELGNFSGQNWCFWLGS